MNALTKRTLTQVTLPKHHPHQSPALTEPEATGCSRQPQRTERSPGDPQDVLDMWAPEETDKIVAMARPPRQDNTPNHTGQVRTIRPASRQTYACIMTTTPQTYTPPGHAYCKMHHQTCWLGDGWTPCALARSGITRPGRPFEFVQMLQQIRPDVDGMTRPRRGNKDERLRLYICRASPRTGVKGDRQPAAWCTLLNRKACTHDSRVSVATGANAVT